MQVLLRILVTKFYLFFWSLDTLNANFESNVKYFVLIYFLYVEQSYLI